MSREIKFRAWDKDNKEMVSPLSRYPSSTLYQTIIGCVIRHEPISDAFIVMQYTGLKDKNGKQIFEGDIVYHDSMTFKVEYHELFAGFKLIGNYDPPSNIVGIDKWKCEVIGNIMENPELLK